MTGTSDGLPRPDERAIHSEAANRWDGWKLTAVGIGIAACVIQWIRPMFRSIGDFHLHWELGRRFVEGTFIYAGAHDIPYPPFWGLVHAPLSVFPVRVAQALLFPLFLVSLYVLLRVLNRLTAESLPLPTGRMFWFLTIVLALASRFLVRDMPECGVNLALVAMSWWSVDLWRRHRERAGAALLGLAMSLKCTPALFLVYFAWKREWRFVTQVCLATAVFSFSPVLRMGPEQSLETYTAWFLNASKGARQTDPSRGVLGDEQLQNMSLRPSLARFLMHLPEGHNSRFDHPLYLDFLDLSPVQAGGVVKGLLLLLGMGVFWQLRHRFADRNDPRLPWECGIISLMILLYSPITWGQHCVGVLPALYLIVRSVAAGRRIPRAIQAVLGIWTFCILVLNRELIGRELTWLIDSYRIGTWCIVMLLGTLLVLHARWSRQAAVLENPSSPAMSRATSRAA